MKKIFTLTTGLFLLSVSFLYGQCTGTATAATSGNWDSGNPGDKATWTFSGGATSVSTACSVIIPTGITVTINNNQEWIANVYVSGTLALNQKLTLGTDPGCGLSLFLESGGKLTDDNSGGANERLVICGKTIITSQPNPPPGSISWPSPPGTGFTGPDTPGFGEGGVLPVKLSYLTAFPNKETIIVAWATIMEENFEKFIIERSTNGKDFEAIGEVPGQGHDIFDIETKYSFEDKAPLLGFNYYRLKAVDLDGSFEYFGPKAAKISGGKRLSISPNPSTGEEISFRTNFNPSESDQIVIIDQLGTELLRFQASTLQNTVTIDNKLKPGVYFLKYVSFDYQEVARVFVKN